MSARISKGDTVRCTHGEPDSGLFVGRNYEAKEVYVRSATGDAYIDVGVDPDGWRAERFEKVEPEHAEPEDKDDLYVEPEPLKEGDWCLIWAQFDTVEPDDDGDVTVDVPGSGLGTQYVRADAIVRPDAGQVPPWVKPAEEPLNIGAVIADRDDAVWARVATGDPGGPWWTRASEGPEESMTYPHHWGDLSVHEVLSEGYMDGGAS